MFKKFILVALTSAILFAPVATLAQPKSCPPGLAKRDNGCLPPGQAKRLAVGEILPEGIAYSLITDLAQYGLPTPNGDWLYYLVDGDILRVADATFTILEILGMTEN